MVLTFSFAEDSFFAKNFRTNFIIPIHARLDFTLGAVTGLVLPIISYILLVIQEGDVKQDVPTKNSSTWRGVKYCMVY